MPIVPCHGTKVTSGYIHDDVSKWQCPTTWQRSAYTWIWQEENQSELLYKCVN